MHFVEPAEIIASVSIRNGKLLSVSILVKTPRAPVVIQEWFGTDSRNRFYLSYIKGTVPEARLQFAAMVPDAQRRKGFAVRTTCLVRPVVVTRSRTFFLSSGNSNQAKVPIGTQANACEQCESARSPGFRSACRQSGHNPDFRALSVSRPEPNSEHRETLISF